MTANKSQIKANQINAQKSTGPITLEGKQIVAQNAVKHGVFSKHLLLQNENQEDYQLLLEGLQTQLHPVGALEQSLIERIAVALWRQRRLIRAETAHLELNNKPSNIANAVNSEMNLHSDKAISKKDLTDYDQEQLNWCQHVIDEYQRFDPAKLTDVEVLKKIAPTIYKQLEEDAKADQEPLASFLSQYDRPLDYFVDLIQYCQAEIEKAKQRPLVLETAAILHNKRAILQGATRDALAKYQVMLDNELYKAIKALREAQDWRFKTLPVLPENGFVLENQPSS